MLSEQSSLVHVHTFYSSESFACIQVTNIQAKATVLGHVKKAAIKCRGTRIRSERNHGNWSRWIDAGES